MGNYCCYEAQYQNLLRAQRRDGLLGRGRPDDHKLIARPHDFFVFGQDTASKSFLSVFDPIGKSLSAAKLPRGACFFNYSATTWKSPTKLIVCGGIRHNLTGITPKCFELDLETYACSPLPDMINFRYTFSAIFFEGKVFVVGGRVYGGDETSILKSCEVFDYALNRWERIASLNIPRCTSTLLVFRGQIWVLGGYTGQYQRSRKIERYCSASDAWLLVEFKLLCGFENGNVLPSGEPNQMVIFGGKLNYGSSRNVWLYDLEAQTVLNKKPLYHENILSKHFSITGGTTCLLGENPPNNYFYETYDLNSGESFQGPLCLPQGHNFEKFKQYNFNAANVVVENQPASSPPPLRNYRDVNVIFGTDTEPFQIEVDALTLEVRSRPLKLGLKLRNFQGCCRVGENRVLFMGGINISFQKISSRVFLFDLQSQAISQLPDMHRMRYTFPSAFFRDCVYVVGGREYGEDKNAIFCDCERFNFAHNAWERIPSLNIKRCTSNIFVLKSRLFVAGGFLPSSKRCDVIEVLNEQRNRWECLGVLLPTGLEASCFVSRRDEVFFLTGRNESGDSAGKFLFRSRKGDLDEVATLPEKASKEGCLNKLVIARDKFVVFGGTDFAHIIIVNSSDLSNTVVQSKGFRGDNSTTLEAEEQGTELEGFRSALRAVVSSVCFSPNYLKRNSYITSTQLSY